MPTPPPETLVDTVPSEESDYDNAAPEEVSAHRIKPEKNNQRKSAESDTVTSQVSMTENLNFEDSGLELSQDPVCPSALDECLMKAAPRAVFLACKAAQNAQGEAENTETDSVEAAFEGGDPALDVSCSSPRRNIYRPLRPSHNIYPIDNSPSSISVSAK